MNILCSRQHTCWLLAKRELRCVTKRGNLFSFPLNNVSVWSIPSGCEICYLLLGEERYCVRCVCVWEREREKTNRRLEKITKWGALWFVLVTEYYSGDQIKDDDTGGTCGVCGTPEVTKDSTLCSAHIIRKGQYSILSPSAHTNCRDDVIFVYS